MYLSGSCTNTDKRETILNLELQYFQGDDSLSNDDINKTYLIDLFSTVCVDFERCTFFF